MGGFECSTHRARDGRRLDLIAATGHDRHAALDYRRLRECGMGAARDGIRWHLIEPSPGRYDFSSVLPLVRAAREAGVQVIWDLCHYGWPDDLDIFAPEFVDRFARLARAFASLLRDETDDIPLVVPVNEISFFSWACGEVGIFHPCARGRGQELKAQLVRAAIAGAEAVWDVHPRARIIHTDPAINILPDPEKPHERDLALGYGEAQYQGWDMLCGRLAPELGGHPRYLDVIGVNYYPHNQWVFNSDPAAVCPMVEREDPRYLPFRQLLRRVYERYRRPFFVAETGAEDGRRPGWLRYVGEEVAAAITEGVPVEGVCLYPVVNHPGWEDDRHCHNGLWDYCDEAGGRELCGELADELRRQAELIEQTRSHVREQTTGAIAESASVGASY